MVCDLHTVVIVWLSFKTFRATAKQKPRLPTDHPKDEYGSVVVTGIRIPHDHIIAHDTLSVCRLCENHQ